MASSPIWVTSLTATGKTLAGRPSPKRASASISGTPWASSWTSTMGGSRPPPAISGEQRAQLAQQCIHRRQRVSGGAGGANRRALSAARTDICIDDDMIAGRCDRAGWAEVEAARAADDLRARMGTKILGEGDVA